MDPSKMTDLELLALNKAKLDEIMPQIKEELSDKLIKAIRSGAIPEEYKVDNYLLIKAVIDSWCRDRPYMLLDSSQKNFANNLHKFI